MMIIIQTNYYSLFRLNFEFTKNLLNLAITVKQLVYFLQKGMINYKTST